MKLLAWLASRAEAPAPNGFEFHGYELHAHPDLIEPLEQLADFPVKRIAAFGIPALAHPNGVVFAFAYGAAYLYFRNVDILSPKIIEAVGSEWRGLDPWFPPEWNTKSIEQRLVEKQRHKPSGWSESENTRGEPIYLRQDSSRCSTRLAIT